MVERRQAAASAGTGATGAAKSRFDLLQSQLTKTLRKGSRSLQATALGGVRLLLPLVEVYAVRKAGSEDGDDAAGSLGLKRGEQAVLVAAGRKVFIELLEITSHTHPVYPGAPAYRAKNDQGQDQAPHLMHLLALAAAARELFGDDDDGDDGGGNAPPPEPQVAQQDAVVFMAVAPGEYQALSGPMTPTQIRRNAMRQRSYATPPPARLASASNALESRYAPGNGAQTVAKRAASASAPAASASKASPATAAAAYRVVGCGCGGHAGCGRCGGSGVRAFPAPRFDADGSCASVTDISCETRWRVRECFKRAFCDLLRCFGDQLCEDGRFAPAPSPAPAPAAPAPAPDFDACLETFVCSLVTCLPDAICPPPQRSCCGDAAPDTPRLPAPACDCNYAVGE